MNWTHFKLKCFGLFVYVLCIPKSFTMVLFSIHFPSHEKIVLLQFYFPVFITHDLNLPENFSCFSDLYSLKFLVLTSQFMPHHVLWHLLISLTIFLATPTHCHRFSYYFRPLDSISDQYLSSWRLFFCLAYSMNLIFMTCQPFKQHVENKSPHISYF